MATLGNARVQTGTPILFGKLPRRHAVSGRCERSASFRNQAAELSTVRRLSPGANATECNSQLFVSGWNASRGPMAVQVDHRDGSQGQNKKLKTIFAARINAARSPERIAANLEKLAEKFSFSTPRSVEQHRESPCVLYSSSPDAADPEQLDWLWVNIGGMPARDMDRIRMSMVKSFAIVTAYVPVSPPASSPLDALRPRETSRNAPNATEAGGAQGHVLWEGGEGETCGRSYPSPAGRLAFVPGYSPLAVLAPAPKSQGVPQKRIVGFARAISDGAFVASICDLVVHPDFEHAGVGQQLISRLMADVMRRGPSNFVAYPEEQHRRYYADLHFRGDSIFKVMQYVGRDAMRSRPSQGEQS
eukprot:jgi/Mesvir1/15219/Mv06449-RA.1